MEQQDDDSRRPQYRCVLIPKCDSVRVMSALYLAALLSIGITGFASPVLFLSKTSSQSALSGISSPDTTFRLNTPNYTPTHQSIFVSTRLNVPVQLRQAIESSGSPSYEAAAQYTVTLYGSPQPKPTSGACASGCPCSDSSESLELTCDLLAFKVAVEQTISCDSAEDWCAWTPLYNVAFVHHKTYYLVVAAENDLSSYVEDADVAESEQWVSEFRFVFVSQWFTGFELVWFYFWAVMTLMVMFMPGYGFFALALSEGIFWRRWSRQQKWACVLLVALFFFNNPFFAAQIFSEQSKAFFIVFALAEGTLVCLLLRFWLDRLFEFGRGERGRPSKEALAQTSQWMLTLIIFVTYVVNMIQLRLARVGDPQREHQYPSNSSDGEQALTILCFVYCGWVIIFSARAYWWGVGREALHRSPRAMFFLVTSGITLLVMLPAIILEHLSPRVKGGFAFAISHGAPNLYIMAMALICAPTTAEAMAVEAFARERSANADDPRQIPEASAVEDFEDPHSAWTNRWWQFKLRRPKITDSSDWEDGQPGTA